MVALFGFMLLVVILVFFINDPKLEEDGSEPPGRLSVAISWASGEPIDVDLWVRAPGDRPVGYSNLSGLVFDLLRDDRGTIGDLDQANFEVAFTRGLPSGLYTINLHLYSNFAQIYPLSVEVVVSIKEPNGKSIKELLRKSVQLTKLGQELTVFNFRIDDSGGLVEGSVTQIPRELRGGVIN